jgi:hypothetical protein
VSRPRTRLTWSRISTTAIDQIIRRCLDDDPRPAPATPLAVALALPGGDAVAAAPRCRRNTISEMVAASEVREGFRRTHGCPVLRCSRTGSHRRGAACLLRNRMLNKLPYRCRQTAWPSGARSPHVAGLRRSGRRLSRTVSIVVTRRPKRQLSVRALSSVTPSWPATGRPCSPSGTGAARLRCSQRGRASQVSGRGHTGRSSRNRSRCAPAAARPARTVDALARTAGSSPGDDCLDTVDWGVFFEAAGLDRTRFMPVPSERVPTDGHR